MKIQQKPGARINAQLRQKYVLFVATSLFLIAATGISIIFIFGDKENAMAASSGDYRTKSSGNWNAASTWQRYNGSTWVNASGSPTDADGEITIRSGHTVTTTSGVDVDQLTIASGGELLHNSGTLKIKNGSGTDISVAGVLSVNAQLTLENSASMAVSGTVNKNSGGFSVNTNATVNVNSGGIFVRSGGSMDIAPGKWFYNAGATYQHDINGGNLVNADWNATSTCLVTGSTNAMPDNLDQSFGNFTFNCTALTGNRNLGSAFRNVEGDLKIMSTGSGSILFNAGSNQTLTVGGNFLHEGGNVYITESGNWITTVGGNLVVSGGQLAMTSAIGAIGSGNPVFEIAGHLLINGGTLDLSQYTGSNTNLGKGTVQLNGDLQINGGTLTASATGVGRGIIYFRGNTLQRYIRTGTQSGTIDGIVNPGAILDVGTSIFNGFGDFTVSAGATLRIGSPEGIAASASSGNIRVSGTRSFSSSANYVYNGSVTQSTGNGLPATVAGLVIDNPGLVTLTQSTSVSSLLNFENGILQTATRTISCGTSALVPGTLTRNNGWVAGNMARWIPAGATGAYLYPVGRVLYNGYTETYTSAPSSPGLRTISFAENNPGSMGLPLMDDSYNVNTQGSRGFWTSIASNGLSGGTVNLSLVANGFSGFSDYTAIRILSRSSAAASWTLTGSHVNGTGSNSNATARRGGIIPGGQHTIGWGYNALPIELIAFKAQGKGRTVLLSWATATEINNDYFSLERSVNGREFTKVGRVAGAGNSSTVRTYTWVDEQPLTGESYYRLRQTDYDGRYEVFPPQRVFIKKEIFSDANVNIWPSPFSESINLEIKMEEDAPLNWSLYSMDGRQIRQEQLFAHSGSIRIDELRQLPAGYYFLRLESSGESWTKKLIKN